MIGLGSDLDMVAPVLSGKKNGSSLPALIQHVIPKCFSATLKVSLKIINILNPELDPQMNVPPLVPQTSQEDRFFSGVSQQDKHPGDRIGRFPDHCTQAKGTFFVLL